MPKSLEGTFLLHRANHAVYSTSIPPPALTSCKLNSKSAA